MHNLVWKGDEMDTCTEGSGSVSTVQLIKKTILSHKTKHTLHYNILKKALYFIL